MAVLAVVWGPLTPRVGQEERPHQRPGVWVGEPHMRPVYGSGCQGAGLPPGPMRNYLRRRGRGKRRGYESRISAPGKIGGSPMKGHTPLPDEHIVHTGIVILASAVEDPANLALGKAPPTRRRTDCESRERRCGTCSSPRSDPRQTHALGAQRWRRTSDRGAAAARPGQTESGR